MNLHYSVPRKSLLLLLSVLCYFSVSESDIVLLKANQYPLFMTNFARNISDPIAILQTTVGTAYLNGWKRVHFDPNILKAMAWYEKAAKRGNPEAAYKLGALYHATHDFSSALQWYRQAAQRNHAFAINDLGVLLSEGKGTKTDTAQASKLFEQAYQLGDWYAAYNIGLGYEFGKGYPQNYSKAANYYLQAAKQGVYCAQNDLGALYAKGKGVVQNDDTASHWFKSAVESFLTKITLKIHNKEIDDKQKKHYAAAFAGYRLATTSITKTAEKLQHALSEQYTPETLETAAGFANFFEVECRH